MVPATSCILAGCLRIQAEAMPVLPVPYFSPSSSRIRFSSAYLGFPKNTPSKIHTGTRPGLNGDILQTAEIQHASVPVRRALRQHVYFHAVCHHLGIGNAELQLIRGNILFHILFQKPDLGSLWLDTPKCRTFPEDSSRSKASATSSGSTRASGLCRSRTSRYSV